MHVYMHMEYYTVTIGVKLISFRYFGIWLPDSLPRTLHMNIQHIHLTKPRNKRHSRIKILLLSNKTRVRIQVKIVNSRDCVCLYSRLINVRLGSLGSVWAMEVARSQGVVGLPSNVDE
jgi:hypothetical protein